MAALDGNTHSQHNAAGWGVALQDGHGCIEICGIVDGADQSSRAAEVAAVLHTVVAS